ncbi:hypothetical protein WN943_005718 [Citrus x changshan-huyou]
MANFSPEILFLSFTASTAILYMINNRRRSRPNSPSLPSPPNKLPIIGHLHLFYKERKPHKSFAELAEKLGPIFYVQLGRVPAVVVSSNELAKQVLKTHDQVFASRPNLLSAKYLSVGPAAVTFSPYGAYWRQARKLCVTELLSPKRVNSFKVVLDEEVNRFMTFGVRFLENEEKEEGQKSRYLASVFVEVEELLTGVIKGTRNLLNSVEEIFDKTSKRKQLLDTSALLLHGNENLIEVLRRVQKRDDLDVPITDDSLESIVSDMFVGGVDPSTATLEWIMTELARHPRSSDKCTLEGYEIPAKTRILINNHAIGRDPKLFENPHDFIPERFQQEDDIKDFKDEDFRFMRFGGGRRGCPGYDFGLNAVQWALARLLNHFDWALPRGVSRGDVDLQEVYGFAARKRVPLVLIPTVNKDYDFNP